MGYDCVVCVKQVPDTGNITGDAMKEDGTVNRQALPAIFNPEDLNALEAALAIRSAHGGTVTVITMGPGGACEVLRDCLFRGADRAILITDRRAAASDTLATSYILSQAVRTVGRYDFVFCGRQAIDGDTAQVGPQMAEKLGISQVTYYEGLAMLNCRTARLRRNVGNGWEILETRLPVLVTVLDTANEPRPAAVRRLMRYKRARAPIEIAREVAEAMPESTEPQKQTECARRAAALAKEDLLIEQWDLDKVNADLKWCGMAGSPTKVHRIQSIVLTKEGYTEIAPTKEGVRQLIHELIVDRTLG
ncbi:MAG TPA: electron transfer flavoprotein subunit beta/FixA family protein [Phycisphaerae bacterium]|nr:electron transfer flavoprotein subunit beta/FixA family protein [Phycisphaerae bacterium]HRY67268.1 electron transfer flavoprotein subunit beta/FixA family protein [Phycisphaerae bacterium]HSA26362.1 electron transfer flavoprotein subunit beta/FixA family protein [Phycisphaerae bacterium]